MPQRQARVETRRRPPPTQESQPNEASGTAKTDQKAGDADNNWPYSSDERKTSKDAWWRTLGRGRKRDTEGRR